MIKNWMVITEKKFDNILLFLAFFLSIITIIGDLGINKSIAYIAQFLEALVFLSVYALHILKQGLDEINQVRLGFIIISLVIMLINRSPEMISSTMMITFIYIIFTEKNINYEKLLKVFTYTTLAIFILIVAAYYIFNFNNHNLLGWRNNEQIFRRALGFEQPNIAMVDYLSIVYGLIALLKRANHRIFYLFLAFVTCIIYTQTKSRTSFYVILAALGLFFILGRHANKRLPTLWGKFITWLPVILLFSSIYFLLTPYNKNLDSLLSHRIHFYQHYYKEGGGLHFLRNLSFKTKPLIDSSYIETLITKGIVFTIQMITIFTSLLNHYAKNMTYKGAILIASFFFVAFTETSLQRFNLFFLMVLILANEASKTSLLKK